MKNFLRIKPLQRVLYITSAGVDCYRVSRFRTTLEQRFDQDEFAIARFYEYTASAPDAVYTLIADLIEEDFRTETIPPLRGTERSALIARRAAQAYRDTPFVASVSLGREAEEVGSAGGAGVAGTMLGSQRRDEAVQLMALTNPEPVQFWLKLLQANEHKIVAILSPATLATHTATALGVPAGAERIVLATLTSAGLRQSYLETIGKERQTRFSRLASDPGDLAASPAVRALGLVAEVARTQQYLQGLRLIARDAPPVPVALVVPRAEAADFEAALQAGEGARLVAQVFVVDDLADTLFVNAATKRAGRDAPASFASPAVTQFFRLNAWRARVIATGAVVGVLGLIAGIALGVQALTIDRATGGLNQETAGLVAQYRQTAAAFPKSPAPLATMRMTVTAVERLQAQTASPESLLRAVGAQLEALGDFQIQRVDWQLATTPTPPLTSDGAAQVVPLAEGVAPAGGAASLRYEVVVLSGRLLLPEPYRAAQAMAQARSVAERLRQLPGAQVSVVTWPVDTTPEGRIAAIELTAGAQAAAGGATAGRALVVRIARPLQSLQSLQPLRAPQVSAPLVAPSQPANPAKPT